MIYRALREWIFASDPILAEMESTQYDGDFIHELCEPLGILAVFANFFLSVKGWEDEKEVRFGIYVPESKVRDPLTREEMRELSKSDLMELQGWSIEITSRIVDVLVGRGEANDYDANHAEFRRVFGDPYELACSGIHTLCNALSVKRTSAALRNLRRDHPLLAAAITDFVKLSTQPDLVCEVCAQRGLDDIECFLSLVTRLDGRIAKGDWTFDIGEVEEFTEEFRIAAQWLRDPRS